MSTVIVAGGAGYIGSHTIRELQNGGFEPVVLDNLVYGHRKIVEDVLGVPLVIGEVGDKKLLEKLLSGDHPSTKGKLIKGIMHFAAYAYVGESVIDPAKYYKNNLAETIILLEALLEDSKKRNSKPIPIVFSSTCATYGLPLETEIPIIETTLQNPINPYGRSKLMIEKILIDYHKAYNLPVSILRYFNAAGADIKGDIGEDHNPETHLIPLVLEALFNKDGFLKVNGIDYPTFDGTCIRDYVHVSDLAKAHVLALNKIINDRSLSIYNLGNGKGYSIMEVIDTAKKVTGKEIKILKSKRRQGDPPVLISLPEKAKKELLWKPEFPDLECIIRTAWNWYLFKEHKKSNKK